MLTFLSELFLIPKLAVFILAFVASLRGCEFLCTALHEIGHLLFALKAGFPVDKMVIGDEKNPILYSFKVFGVSVVIRQGRLNTGLVRFEWITPDSKKEWDYFAMVFAGPAFNLFAALVATFLSALFLVSKVHSSGSSSYDILLIVFSYLFIVENFACFIGNVIPDPKGKHNPLERNDGNKIFEFLEERFASEKSNP